MDTILEAAEVSSPFESLQDDLEKLRNTVKRNHFRSRVGIMTLSAGVGVILLLTIVITIFVCISSNQIQDVTSILAGAVCPDSDRIHSILCNKTSMCHSIEHGVDALSSVEEFQNLQDILHTYPISKETEFYVNAGGGSCNGWAYHHTLSTLRYCVFSKHVSLFVCGNLLIH